MSKSNPQHDQKDNWDKAGIALDLIYKAAILIVGSIAAGAFYFIQDRGAQQHSLADLMAQRENSDSQLREQMFRTLFDAYFADMVHATSISGDTGLSGDSPTTGAGASQQAKSFARLEMLKRESMFSDLLSRNFDDIDVRPLLEDLDAQLSRHLVVDGKNSSEKNPANDELRQKAFALREYLRRAAIGAASRQVTALAGGVRATVVTKKVTQCKGGQPDPPLPFDDWTVQAVKLSDGVVDMRVFPNDAVADAPTYLDVSFYDMPTLENIILPSGERVAFTLTRYISHDACVNFQTQLDESLQQDCVALLSKKGECDEAWLKAVVFPDDYVGARDRPYINDVIEGRLGHAGTAGREKR